VLDTPARYHVLGMDTRGVVVECGRRRTQIPYVRAVSTMYAALSSTYDLYHLSEFWEKYSVRSFESLRRDNRVTTSSSDLPLNCHDFHKYSNNTFWRNSLVLPVIARQYFPISISMHIPVPDGIMHIDHHVTLLDNGELVVCHHTIVNLQDYTSPNEPLLHFLANCSCSPIVRPYSAASHG
jgi:hypothetical protein